MINPNLTKEHKVTYKEILERVRYDERVLLCMYLDVPRIPCLINSPLRDDKKPSFRFAKEGDKIYWIDFSTGEKGNLFEFLMKFLNLNKENLLDRLNTDTGGSELPKGVLARVENLKKSSDGVSRFTLKATHRNWEKRDIEFWGQFGITTDWLKRANVFPISFIWFEGEDRKFYIPAEPLAYAYYEFKDGIARCKIYQPKSKEHKWYNNLTEDVWSLWTMLPKSGNHLFITSSLKDALNLWINTGVPSVSMQGEGYIPKEKVINELKARFKNIWIFFDNDYNNPNNPGRTDAKKLCKQFGLFYVEIPSKYKSKDPSDLFRNCGKEMYKQAIREGLQLAKLYKDNIL